MFFSYPPWSLATLPQTCIAPALRFCILYSLLRWQAPGCASDAWRWRPLSFVASTNPLEVLSSCRRCLSLTRRHTWEINVAVLFCATISLQVRPSDRPAPGSSLRIWAVADTRSASGSPADQSSARRASMTSERRTWPQTQTDMAHRPRRPCCSLSNAVSVPSCARSSRSTGRSVGRAVELI